eukprot:14733_1
MVALHYVYNTPEDMIIWDVSHLVPTQDSHGTAPSNAFTPPERRTQKAYDREETKSLHCIVIRDGAICGGMAFEAMMNSNGYLRVRVSHSLFSMTMVRNGSGAACTLHFQSTKHSCLKCMFVRS